MPELNSTVGFYYNMPPLDEKDSVGIEVELEAGENSIGSFKRCKDFWSLKHDGSLRGAFNAEYVLSNPQSKDNSFESLDYLTNHLSRCDVDLLNSVRTGVHIHINVRDLSFIQLWTFVSCYYVLEEMLTDWCGEGRQGNHFCLRAIDADFVISEVVKTLKDENVYRLDTQGIRYAALNFNSLSKFGSLEFRQLRTPPDFSVIKIWIEILLTIKQNSSLFSDPKAVVENFSQGGEEFFLRAILENLAEIFFDNESDINLLLRRGVRVAQELAYSRRW